MPFHKLLLIGFQCPCGEFFLVFCTCFCQVLEHDVGRVLVNDAEIWFQADLSRMPADIAGDDRVECPHHDPADVCGPGFRHHSVSVSVKRKFLLLPSCGQFRLQALTQIGGCGTGERDQQDVPGLVLLQDPFRPGKNGRGLSRPRTGNPDHR